MAGRVTQDFAQLRKGVPGAKGVLDTGSNLAPDCEDSSVARSAGAVYVSR